MSKVDDLVYALHQKTIEKRLTWDVQDDATISVNLGRNSVTLSQFWNGDKPDLFKVSIQNMDGNTVDQEEFSSENEIYNRLSEMMVKAKRNALRADETLDEILERVSKM